MTCECESTQAVNLFAHGEEKKENSFNTHLYRSLSIEVK